MPGSVRENDLGPKLADDYFGVLSHALTLVDPSTHALEFGVASGQTIRMIDEVMSVTGFDSFKGLPEDWRPGFEKGRFEQAVPDVGNAELVIGWFDDTLPVWVRENKGRLENLGLVHIDCDLYSSTVTIFRNLVEYLTAGVIIVFDEYHGYPGWEDHEYKAWNEFVYIHEVDYEVLGHGPEQLAVRIK